MQGILLVGLRKFVVDRLGDSLWKSVQAEAGVVDRVYLPAQAYPDEDFSSIVAGVSRLTGMTQALILESFGDFLAADLVRMFSGLIDPRKKLIDVLAQCDELIGRAVLMQGGVPGPAVLHGQQISPTEVVLHYEAPLRLCPMIRGVVRGIAAHMDQAVAIDELRCVSTGASACELAVRLERNAKDAERMAQGLRRRLTPSQMGAVREPGTTVPPPSSNGDRPSWTGDRPSWASDRPSWKPSLPPPSMPPSSGAVPPSSGVVPAARGSRPSSVPAPERTSEPPPLPQIDEASEIKRRR